MSPSTLRRSPRKAVECVSGILVRRGTVLVETRRDDDTDPGFVLLPGGHVETGESLKSALAREMREELGIIVAKIVPVGIRYHVATDGERQRVHYFHVREWTGKISSREAERVYWESKVDRLSDKAERRIVRRFLKEKRDE
jgi:8-oxo-dGTP diphosphatase